MNIMRAVCRNGPFLTNAYLSGMPSELFWAQSIYIVVSALLHADISKLFRVGLVDSDQVMTDRAIIVDALLALRFVAAVVAAEASGILVMSNPGIPEAIWHSVQATWECGYA
jgi:hypothetical protein